MREIKDLTVVICSYKANKEFKLCLHQLSRYGFTGKDLLIYENSPSTYKSNREFLNSHKIKYIDNPDGTHTATMNLALQTVKTKYALLLDSDCFCIADPYMFMERIVKHKVQLFGEICGDRGGYHIHKRVHPWWCYVDVDYMKKHKIPVRLIPYTNDKYLVIRDAQKMPTALWNVNNFGKYNLIWKRLNDYFGTRL